MINFFSRKTYLVDELSGFIDIHNHILPAIDDGAKSVEDSLALIKGFREFGIQDLIATPHIMHNYYDNTPKTIGTALDLVNKELEKNNTLDSKIVASAEHMIDGNFETILENGSIMTLGKEYLLVEMSYLQPPINFNQAINAITNKWLYPVLAHPERYGFLHGRPRKYVEFKNQNILFQMNLLSLGGYYGKEVHKVGLKLLEEEMIDFVGSDVHNLHQLEELKKVTLSKKHLNLIKPILERTIASFQIT